MNRVDGGEQGKDWEPLAVIDACAGVPCTFNRDGSKIAYARLRFLDDGRACLSLVISAFPSFLTEHEIDLDVTATDQDPSSGQDASQHFARWFHPLVASNDGQHVLVTSDMEVRAYAWHDGELACQITIGDAMYIATTSDGKKLFVIDRNANIIIKQIVDDASAPSTTITRSLKDYHIDQVRSVSFLPNQDHVVVLDNRQHSEYYVLDMNTGEKLACSWVSIVKMFFPRIKERYGFTFRTVGEGVIAQIFEALDVEGKTCLVPKYDDQVVKWFPSTDLSDIVKTSTVSPDMEYLVYYSSRNKTFIIHHIKTNEWFQRIHHAFLIRPIFCEFSPDGSFFIAQGKRTINDSSDTLVVFPFPPPQDAGTILLTSFSFIPGVSVFFKENEVFLRIKDRDDVCIVDKNNRGWMNGLHDYSSPAFDQHPNIDEFQIFGLAVQDFFKNDFNCVNLQEGWQTLFLFAASQCGSNLARKRIDDSLFSCMAHRDYEKMIEFLHIFLHYIPSNEYEPFTLQMLDPNYLVNVDQTPSGFLVDFKGLGTIFGVFAGSPPPVPACNYYTGYCLDEKKPYHVMAAASLSDTRVLISLGCGLAFLYSLRDKRVEKIIDKEEYFIQCVFPFINDRFFTIDGRGEVFIFDKDMTTGTQCDMLFGDHDKYIESFTGAFSPDGVSLVFKVDELDEGEVTFIYTSKPEGMEPREVCQKADEITVIPVCPNRINFPPCRIFLLVYMNWESETFSAYMHYTNGGVFKNPVSSGIMGEKEGSVFQLIKGSALPLRCYVVGENYVILVNKATDYREFSDGDEEWIDYFQMGVISIDTSDFMFLPRLPYGRILECDWYGNLIIIINKAESVLVDLGKGQVTTIEPKYDGDIPILDDYEDEPLHFYPIQDEVEKKEWLSFKKSRWGRPKTNIVSCLDKVRFLVDDIVYNDEDQEIEPWFAIESKRNYDWWKRNVALAVYIRKKDALLIDRYNLTILGTFPVQPKNYNTCLVSLVGLLVFVIDTENVLRQVHLPTGTITEVARFEFDVEKLIEVPGTGDLIAYGEQFHVIRVVKPVEWRPGCHLPEDHSGL